MHPVGGPACGGALSWLPMNPSPPPRLQTRAAVLVLLAGCAAFALFAADLVRAGPITAADARISGWFEASAHPVLTSILLAVTKLHSTLGVLLMVATAALVLAWRRQREWLALLLACVPGGMLLNVLVKSAFQRARPAFEEPLVTLATYSFPSGHAAAATVWWGFALVWLFAHHSGRAGRALGSALAVTLVGLTALSRVYLGAHYPSDVLAAIAEGAAWLALWFWLHAFRWPVQRHVGR